MLLIIFIFIFYKIYSKIKVIACIIIKKKYFKAAAVNQLIYSTPETACIKKKKEEYQKHLIHCWQLAYIAAVFKLQIKLNGQRKGKTGFIRVGNSYRGLKHRHKIKLYYTIVEKSRMKEFTF